MLILVTTSLILIYYICFSFKPTSVYRTSWYQLSAAVNAQLCHTPHSMDPNAARWIAVKKVEPTLPVYDLPKLTHFSSLAFYCNRTILDTGATIKAVKNYEVGEGLTLFYLDRVLMGVFGNLSLENLVLAYRALQILLIGIFVFYLIAVGVRWPSASAFALIAIAITCNPTIITLNANSFILPCLLCLMGLYGIDLRFGLYRSGWKHNLWLFIIALLMFFLYYTRSSELPQMLLLTFGYLYYLWRYSATRYLNLLRLIVVFFLVSLVCYQIFVDTVGNKDYLRGHPIIHPVVLGIGSPPNGLSRREKIIFVDKYGLMIAQRVNPKVTTYYTPAYNQALTTYYKNLWQRYPTEMRTIYLNKFNFVFPNTNRLIQSNLQKQYGWNGTLVKVLFYPFKILGYSSFFFLVLGLTAFLGWRYLKKPGLVTYLFLMSSAFAVLNFLESALIASAFYLTYQSFLVFYFLSVVFLFWEMVICFSGQAARAPRLKPIDQ
ncbi:MAG: hypothetical protein QM752_02285 [Gammaproteobacteria bacterium]